MARSVSSEAIASARPTESAALTTVRKSGQNPLPSACEHERSASAAAPVGCHCGRFDRYGAHLRTHTPNVSTNRT